jgi:hypothetical protein
MWRYMMGINWTCKSNFAIKRKIIQICVMDVQIQELFKQLTTYAIWLCLLTCWASTP